MRRLIAFAAIAILSCAAGCGGSGLSTATPTPTPTGSNVAVITVDAGPSTASNIASVNTPFVSVTICAPGSTTDCQTIDHVEVDTGSYGLRILASVLNSTFTLPLETNGAGGAAIVECTVFADGFSWGPVKTADIQIAGEVASAVPIQIIGDPAFPGVPAACSSTGPAEDTVATFGANGILGIGTFIQDDPNNYYTCAAGLCAPFTITPLMQVSNPVAFFAADNNGVIIELPTVPAAGAAPFTGSLVFGIGTESNNGLGTATVYTLDPIEGVFSVTYNNQTYDNSFIDSGSNANYFVDGSIPTCASDTVGAGFFCPTSTLNLSATNVATNNVSNTVAFSVANAGDLFNGNAAGVAFANLAAANPASDSFDWGLPFFYGRAVYTAIADQNTPAGVGPYYAY
jgi:Protein of unknown function (DUF3443)